MIAQFIPFTAYLAPCLFFAFVFAITSWVAWFALVALRKFAFFKSLRTSGVTPAISMSLGLIAVWLCWPNLHDYSDVAAIAKPGVHISVVVSEFGHSSQWYALPNGAQTYLYAEGLVTGYTSIETNPKGVIVNVEYVD